MGWIKLGNVSFYRFPVGLAIKGTVESGSSTLTPWVMPKLVVTRGFGDTETDFGASGGLSTTGGGGFGMHAVLDAFFPDGDVALTFGVGLHYLTGQD